MEQLINSRVVGATLCLSLFLLKLEENAQRTYKFSASGVLQEKLDRINWNEHRTNFNEFMKFFRHPIQVRTFEDGDNGFFNKKLQFMNGFKLERLATLIIQQQTMNSGVDL